jgi:NDP-sugar pyrophosphorylase family protein
MEPGIIDYIPPGVPFGFDNLMHAMLREELPVRTFLHNGLWLDIGRVEDFHKAQQLGWDDGSPAFEQAPVTFDAVAAA